MTFAERMSNFEEGIFSVLAAKRRELTARGVDVIDLSIGTPDFPPEPHVMKALSEAALDPENYKYAVTDRPFLIEAVQRWYQRRYGVALDPDQILALYGSQEGIAHVAFPLCDPGDVVLMPDPGYPIFSYGPLIAGAKLVTYPLLRENGFLPDLDAIDPAVAQQAKAMVVSFPANPVTALAPRSFYEQLVAFAKRYDIVVLHDNAYSELVFDGEEGISFLSIPGAMDVGIEFNSLSKTYDLTGARISFALGNREVIGMFRRFRSQIDYGIVLPVQYAAAAALDGPQDSVARIREGYRTRSRALSQGLTAIGWDCPDAKGTMFVWAPLPEGYTDSTAFVLELMERTGVICVPGISFGSLGEGYVRFALSTSAERIEEAVRRIAQSGMLH